MLEGFRQQSVMAAEGFPLAAFVRRPDAGVAAGVPLFLVNGLGGHIVTWRHFIRHFAPRHAMATWDYRGLYASRFEPETKAAYRRGEVPISIETQATDALRVMDALGIEKAVLVGWSMGVQLGFEIAHRAPDRVQGLVQICGAPGRTMASTVLGTHGEKMIPPVMDAFRRAAERFAPTMAKAVGSPLALRMAKLVGMVAPSLDEGLAQEIVHDYMQLDFEVYNAILADLGRHDMAPFLGQLGASGKPVLVVAGTRDTMTPVKVGEAMAARIPGSEIEVVTGGSHYLPIEFPGRLNEVVESFLARRVA